ncbi:hypothetical protein FJY70_03120 [candidate division WOR-3 bacterium]|nr:hypothetical protein [candidate division WOR-3 bacterium]
MNRVSTILATTLLVATALAGPSYTGYSGAPGTSGTCASSCHGPSGGTIEVVGFPAAYELGQTYVVSVVHRGGSSINNFNASVRVGSGSATIGIITAGYRTATYSIGTEPNGVHLSSENRDSCTFTWQAPDTAVGDVKLYLAGHQGRSMNGPNSDIVLTASQTTGVNHGRAMPTSAFNLRMEPTIGAGSFSVRMVIPPGSPGVLRVTDRNGRVVARVSLAPDARPERALTLTPGDGQARRLTAGTYFVTLSLKGRRLTTKLVVR